MRVVSLAKRDLLEDSGVEECDVLVGVSEGDSAQVAWKTLILLAGLLGEVLVDSTLSDLECQSRVVLCNTRGDSLMRSVQADCR